MTERFRGIPSALFACFLVGAVVSPILAQVERNFVLPVTPPHCSECTYSSSTVGYPPVSQYDLDASGGPDFRSVGERDIRKAMRRLD